jgi:hypothetical protein
LAAASQFILQRGILGAALLPALIGTVGESAARDIEAMVNLADSMPRFEQIVAAPTKVKLPAGVGAYYLMAFMLAGRATAENLSGLISYVNRWDQFEARVLFAMTLAKSKSRVGMACSNRDFTKLAADVGAYF